MLNLFWYDMDAHVEGAQSWGNEVCWDNGDPGMGNFLGNVEELVEENGELVREGGLIMAPTDLRLGSFYPVAFQELPGFRDSSYGNDCCDSIEFRIGASAYRVWVDHIDDSLREHDSKRYEVMTLVEDVVRDVVLSTESPVDLVAWLTQKRIAAGAMRLLVNINKKGDILAHASRSDDPTRTLCGVKIHMLQNEGDDNGGYSAPNCGRCNTILAARAKKAAKAKGAATTAQDAAAAPLEGPRVIEGPAPTENYKGVWTPWAKVMCLACHGPQFGDKMTAPDKWAKAILPQAEGEKNQSLTTCMDCGCPVWVRDDVGWLNEIRKEVGGSMEQTGGMCAGLSIEGHHDYVFVTALDGPIIVGIYADRDTFENGEAGEWNELPEGDVEGAVGMILARHTPSADFIYNVDDDGLCESCLRQAYVVTVGYDPKEDDPKGFCPKETATSLAETRKLLAAHVECADFDPVGGCSLDCEPSKGCPKRETTEEAKRQLKEDGDKLARILIWTFQRAIAADKKQWDSQEAEDTNVAAFDLAKKHGWDWDDDEQFMLWCLHATGEEILREGLKRALVNCKPEGK
jgi:hypothetical protein